MINHNKNTTNFLNGANPPNEQNYCKGEGVLPWQMCTYKHGCVEKGQAQTVKNV
jgi:hypothetical protein